MRKFICIEGLDGLGKTTQINLLQDTLQKKGWKVHSTRALGGDGKDDFQLSIRKTILSNKFPKENAILEEELFALADGAGTEVALKFLNDTPEGVVLKDRGLVSHLCYAAAKDLDMVKIRDIFSPQAKMEAQIEVDHGCHYIVMIPDDISWLQDRIKTRNIQTGVEIVERLENENFQRKVLEQILTAVKRNGIQTSLPVGHIKFSLVEVGQSDSPDKVLSKVLAALTEE